MVAAVALATVPVREYSAPGAGVGSVVHTTVQNYYSNNVNKTSNSSNYGNRIASSTTTLNFM